MESAPSWDETVRRFLLEHRFGMDEVVTKLSILRDEFAHLHDYNPIEQVSSRLKSPESLLEKMQRRGIDLDGPDPLARVREEITDIAGVRVVCSFVSDVYHVVDLLMAQQDVTTLELRDYIASPKPNGYRSLHALVEVPVFLSEGTVPVVVEVQFRTIAMDFWASLEHKIYYKYRRDVPADLLAGLKEAADTAYALDATMERLHQEVQGLEPLSGGLVERLRTASATMPAGELIDSLRRLGSPPEV
ncbi:GTP pyrophosphokinase family protein [Nocardioides sp. zg-579]|uniref:GTP pyrophosphokinase family protein n=1 Tax=Nocardioides marmotae TaxID=2663857 RepID=A0A6I3JDF4_9ACTN|nr:GTP pyrophosphokinase family protein [Nocardioides marmotae]MCR6032498.1 GTP pyrophosphokinase family protein [Gordonia jinghuaiqii]MTB96147.1 GTP pyrophosphokinase family protein [Nocardioides marmotae]QKD99777.1 GTP pyrophosphokinase family protein [Nocardioides marmotae]